MATVPVCMYICMRPGRGPCHTYIRNTYLYIYVGFVSIPMYGGFIIILGALFYLIKGWR